MNTWINSKTRIPDNYQEVWLSNPSGADYKAVFLWCRNKGVPTWRASAPSLADGQLLVEHRDWRPVEPSQWRDSREYPPAQDQEVWAWEIEANDRADLAYYGGYDSPNPKGDQGPLWSVPGVYMDYQWDHFLWQPVVRPEPPTT